MKEFYKTVVANMGVDALESQPAPDERVFRLLRNFADRKRPAESHPADWTSR
jgi:hypothetical protein